MPQHHCVCSNMEVFVFHNIQMINIQYLILAIFFTNIPLWLQYGSENLVSKPFENDFNQNCETRFYFKYIPDTDYCLQDNFVSLKGYPQKSTI